MHTLWLDLRGLVSFLLLPSLMHAHHPTSAFSSAPFTLRPQAGCPRRGYGATRSLASSTGSPPTFRSHDQPQAPDTTIATCWRRAHVFSWPPSGRAREAKSMSTIDFRIALKITRTEKTVHALRAVDRFGRTRIVSYLVARWSMRK